MCRPVYMKKSLSGQKLEKAKEKLNKLSQKKLAKIVKKAPEQFIRKAAAERLTDQSTLAEVAKNDVRLVRDAAVNNLTDQSALAEIAKNDKDKDVRKAAVKKLTDQSALAEIAKNDSDYSIRKAAVRKITDQTLLKNIAVSDADGSLRAQAALQIDEDKLNQSMLFDIVRYASDSYESLKAVEKLTDHKVLIKIARGTEENSDIDDHIRMKAINKLFNSISGVSYDIQSRDDVQGAINYLNRNEIPLAPLSPEQLESVLLLLHSSTEQIPKKIANSLIRLYQKHNSQTESLVLSYSRKIPYGTTYSKKCEYTLGSHNDGCTPGWGHYDNNGGVWSSKTIKSEGKLYDSLV